MKKNILIIFGGRSTEYNISLKSASSVIKNIDSNKYNIYKIGITQNGKWLLTDATANLIESGEWTACDNREVALSLNPLEKALIILEGDNFNKINIDVAFPVMHGAFGEDGTIQGLLEIAGIPYVGPNVAASANCMDKAITKTILDHAGIPNSKYLVFNNTDKEQDIIDKVNNTFSFPVFIKPSSSGSSIGINKATDNASLIYALKQAFLYGKKIIVEEFINGREIEVAILGNDFPVSSCCGEIVPANDFYDFDAKYNNANSTLHIPADIEENITKTMQELAINAYKALGCKGLSRIDFFVCDDGKVILNEINTIPGFTSISMYPKLFDYIGISYSKLLDKLIDFAMEG